MAVDSVTGTQSVTQTNTTTTASTSDAKTATLNYDSFLKLLVAQMKNQDPTDPVDATEQMSQLASFSNVEQAIKTNSHLESLIQETTLTQATSLIGKTVTSSDGKTTALVLPIDCGAASSRVDKSNGADRYICRRLSYRDFGEDKP